MRSILTAALVAVTFLGSAGAQASKAAPPTSSHNTFTAWHTYCTEQPASWSQEVL